MKPPPLPSDLVLEPLEKQDGAPRFESGDGRKPEQEFRLRDPGRGQVWGYVVVDDTRRGPGLGGIRMAPDVTLGETRRLARVMTLKNSAARLPYGGGKSSLIADPNEFLNHPDAKAELITRFARALFPLEQYCPAPDMGTDEKDIERICQVFSQTAAWGTAARRAAGRPAVEGGIPIDDWGLTAHGLFAAAQTLEKLDPEFSIPQTRVVIQGYGNVGSWTAEKLHSAGALIVGASDIHAGLWNPRGLDVKELHRVRRMALGLQNYSGPTHRRFSPNQIDWLLEAPCDLLVPAARPDAITARNAGRIQCRVILQGANTPSNKMTEYYLENRRQILSLPDFIVNAGGVIGCAVELKMTAGGDYKPRVLQRGAREYLEDLVHHTVSRNITEIYQRWAGGKPSDTLFREVALALAEERLGNPETDSWL